MKKMLFTFCKCHLKYHIIDFSHPNRQIVNTQIFSNITFRDSWIFLVGLAYLLSMFLCLVLDLRLILFLPFDKKLLPKSCNNPKYDGCVDIFFLSHLFHRCYKIFKPFVQSYFSHFKFGMLHFLKLWLK